MFSLACLPGFWLLSGSSQLSPEPVVQTLWEGLMPKRVFSPTCSYTHAEVGHTKVSWTVRFDEPKNALSRKKMFPRRKNLATLLKWEWELWFA